jgi:hypothetical protein
MRKSYKKEETLEMEGKNHCGCQCHNVGKHEKKDRSIISNPKQSDHKSIITSMGDTSETIGETTIDTDKPITT